MENACHKRGLSFFGGSCFGSEEEGEEGPAGEAGQQRAAGGRR